MRRRLSLIPLSIVALTGLAAFGNAPVQTAREAPPGEGVVCAWALYSFASDVVERCPSNVSPEMKAELKRSVERLDAYVRANSEITQEDFDQFKREQANVGRPEAEICQADADEGLVDAMTQMPVTQLRIYIDDLTARPGAPTWGTCL
ncbi:hypothetical protein [Brevundimonas sp.]|uniref:hypothetical protein n=1 Tax=Brevundimonas sp. TaxID=1871086 RepID=UPI003F6F9C63